MARQEGVCRLCALPGNLNSHGICEDCEATKLILKQEGPGGITFIVCPFCKGITPAGRMLCTVGKERLATRSLYQTMFAIF